jgi:uncharacterized membrane protein YjjB (DUF3815 family)
VTELLKCRRTFVACIAMGCLTALGLQNHLDVATAISAIAMAVAGSNALEKSMQARATAAAQAQTPKA